MLLFRVYVVGCRCVISLYFAIFEFHVIVHFRFRAEIAFAPSGVRYIVPPSVRRKVLGKLQPLGAVWVIRKKIRR
jgi:hypothetical protein